MRGPAPLDLEIHRGAKWSVVMEILDAADEPVDISEAAFDGPIKIRNAAFDEIPAEFSFENFTDGTDGKVLITLPGDQSLLLSNKRLYEFAWFVTLAGDEPRKIVAGNLTPSSNHCVPTLP